MAPSSYPGPKADTAAPAAAPAACPVQASRLACREPTCSNPTGKLRTQSIPSRITIRHWLALAVLAILQVLPATLTAQDDTDPYYYTTGELAGSLKSDAPLPLYDPDPTHLWNRLFAAWYVRPSNVPGEIGGQPIARIEGGDWIDFLAWSGTDHWAKPENHDRVRSLLDEFLATHGEQLVRDPVKRVILLRDLWAAYDFLAGQNIERLGSRDDIRRRRELCMRLARVIGSLTLNTDEIAALPNTYELALASGSFSPQHNYDASHDYLPPRLLTAPDEWVEIDFYQPSLHEDLADRFITLHTRAYRGRSYFRVFYRFPGGRAQLEEYLRYIDKEGVDWRFAAQNGFAHLHDGLRQIPAGTEVALVQFMMTLDSDLRPTPTPIVESVRLRVYADPNGSGEPPTNTGVGMNVYEYTLKRRLLFDGARQGGLHREPDDALLYRVIFQSSRDAPDWGPQGRERLVQQCVNCHTGGGPGVYSIVSLTNQGGFDAGAQIGVAVPLAADRPSPRASRTARWKSRDETWRRLVETIEAAREDGGR